MARSLVKLHCKRCGKTFERERHRAEAAKYCGYECKNAAETRNEVRSCVACGQEFKPKRAGQQACSLACRDLSRPRKKVRSDAGQRRAVWVTEPCVACGTLVERRKSETRRSVYCSKECFAAAPPNYGSTGRGRPPLDKGTRRVVEGYVRIKVDAGRWRPEHRVVMEARLGRKLLPGENVHHIDGIRTDNRPENLQLWVEHQPKGQAAHELLAWARELLARYEPIEDKIG